MRKKYVWKIPSLSKGVDPNAAIKEIKYIEKKEGKITPEILVISAKNKNSVLHNLFEWDDSKAAYNYRLQQARTLLNNIDVIVKSDGEPRLIPFYEVIKKDSGSIYKSVDSFDETDIEQIRISTIRDINLLKSKLSVYNKFDEVIGKLDEAINLIEM